MKVVLDLLFSKLIERKVPAIVIRTLIFNYEEQIAWVKWGNTKSQQFKIAAWFKTATPNELSTSTRPLTYGTPSASLIQLKC